MKNKPKIPYLDPSVETARRIAEEFQKDMAIVLTMQAGRLTMHSYGRDKASCRAAGKLGEACFLKVMEMFKEAASVAKQEREQGLGPAAPLFKPVIIDPDKN